MRDDTLDTLSVLEEYVSSYQNSIGNVGSSGNMGGISFIMKLKPTFATAVFRRIMKILFDAITMVGGFIEVPGFAFKLFVIADFYFMVVSSLDNL